MENECINIGIAFKLPKEIADKVITLSKELAQEGETVFILDKENF